MNAPLRETQPPGLSIPFRDGAVCLDCLVIFNGREERACTKCGSEISIARVAITGIKTKEPAAVNDELSRKEA